MRACPKIKQPAIVERLNEVSLVVWKDALYTKNINQKKSHVNMIVFSQLTSRQWLSFKQNLVNRTATGRSGSIRQYKLPNTIHKIVSGRLDDYETNWTLKMNRKAGGLLKFTV